MATTNSTTNATSTLAHSTGSLLAVLPALPREQLDSVLAELKAALNGDGLLVAVPEVPPDGSHPGIQFLALSANPPSWILTASDFANACQLAQKQNARCLLMLGPESGSLGGSALRALAGAATSSTTDLVVPWYDLQPRAGLVNSAILYPLSRALFATRVRYPLAVDLGISVRMADKLAAVAQRLMVLNQSDAPIWPLSEASVNGMTISEVDVGPRAVPQPPDPNLNTILPFLVGSLFSDIDAKAAFWQRPRPRPPAHKPIPTVETPPADSSGDIDSMIQAFRLAYTNLLEIWSLVLPPNSLLGLKRISILEGSQFRMPDGLWVRIVFDFLVAFRLRTINRNHLLGALIPLYRAWVAGHMNLIASGINPERHIEDLASAFEADKAYLVARWRWPDRFNP